MAMMLLKQRLTRRNNPMAKKYKKTITIDRSKWCRGNRFAGGEFDGAGVDDTALLTNAKTMCCLGFFCHQSGVPNKDLMLNGTPEAIPAKYHKMVTALVDTDGSPSDSSFSNAAMEINDSTRIDEKTREMRLKKLFAEYNYRIVFVGRTPRITK